jgi:hypothetical protein
MASQKKAILIDGNSILFRMFYGIRGMASTKGVPTNAIYGFVKLLQQIQNEMRPDYLAVAFDLPEPTFRHKKYDGYKAGRDKMPEELITQLDLMKKLLAEMQVPVLTLQATKLTTLSGRCPSISRTKRNRFWRRLSPGTAIPSNWLKITSTFSTRQRAAARSLKRSIRLPLTKNTASRRLN